ncbi:LysR family transcriptional regulator [Bradyrhizobium sp. 83002]|uniref:LysR family transcriptional regulator n=1 Tax=Bradyrhizobium aeschynomenes TaxID=2734909 RepID=UPI00155562F7|nr:LysR family transcriptional regulator [Bradyrhizobium aeschynomenes]NPU15175.1 LysR family transcriptional regulator [Bradyrhizobium aeschynomenes]NPV24543.1 LysR family transcriptional regulator [Bradyrhizobium aeschynomenes]
MELKWLEDFLSLARTRSFSRSAEERHVTQSAFSRRIQALELWLGVSLIDRSSYPTTLTAEGRLFLETAEETVRMLHASRVSLQASMRPTTQMVSVAALHTLSLRFFPRWFRSIEAQVGQVGSRLLPDDFHSCLQAIVEGSYDFLLTFHHPNVPIPLEPELYPHLVVGTDSLVAARSPRLACGEDDTSPLPLLSYATSSFLGRLATFAQAQFAQAEAGAPPVQVAHTNENAMADALRFMALEGHGLAWLPRSLIARDLDEGSLILLGPEIPLDIRLYRSVRRTRPIVERVWSAARQLAGETMTNWNGAVGLGIGSGEADPAS